MTDDEIEILKKDVNSLIKNKILRTLYNKGYVQKNFGLHRHDIELYSGAKDELEKDRLIIKESGKIILSQTGKVFAEKILTDIT